MAPDGTRKRMLAVFVFTGLLFGYVLSSGTTECAGIGDMHFAGGSMSFKFIDTSSDLYKIRITSVTGWKLGQGPCGENCTLSDVGRSTKDTRTKTLDAEGEMYFGNWSQEIGGRNNQTAYYNINSNVTDSLTGEVSAVNVPMRWEQEIAEIILNIEADCKYTDISYEGCYWRSFDYARQTYPAGFNIQVKIKPSIRNDTGQPNNSPVAIFKPVYKLFLNSEVKIKLSTMDDDEGDYVRCSYAEFVEAGGLVQMKHTHVSEDCTVTITTDEAKGFTDGGWGAIPVKVQDFNTNLIQKQDGTIHDPTEALSTVNLQFMIQTLKTIKAPGFVEPTKESQHEFNVYAGSVLKIGLYARPNNESNSEVSSFYLRSIPRRTFHTSPLKQDTSRIAQHVKYSIVTWRPGKDDNGMYLLSALVTDSSGSDGLDRNYIIIVKDVDFLSPDKLPLKGPYFPYFPDISGIVCTRGSTCSFPIYAKSREAGASIQAVLLVASTFDVTDIDTPVAVKKNNEDMFVVDVTVTEPDAGDQRVCLKARDSNGLESESKCLGVKISQPDPCTSQPCKNQGNCAFDGVNFTCACLRGFEGPYCESGIDYCRNDTCDEVGGTCISYPLVSGTALCQCITGRTGPRCDVDIVDCKPDSCSFHGTCVDKTNSFTCECFKGYSGTYCETHIVACQPDPCNNHGTCEDKTDSFTCECFKGYSGTYCETQKVSDKGCQTPLWGKGMISAGNVHASSTASGIRVSNMLVDCCPGIPSGGWCPDSTLDAKSQYIEVTFPRKLGVKAIEIQPPQGTDPFYQGMSRHYLTNYTFQYTPYGATNLSTYGTQGGPLYLLGVRGSAGTVVSTITEIVGLVTDRVRISIVDFVNQPCFRFDIFGCEPEELCTPACDNGGFCVYENTCACPPPFYGLWCKNTHLPVNSGCLKPLGMWSGDIKDSQLTVSSFKPGKEKEKARYLCCLGEDRGAWCPSPNDTAPFYEVHLDKPYLVAMFMFQHPSKVNFWEVPDTYMKTFTLQYRNLELDRMETFAVNIDAIKSTTQGLNPTFDPFILTDVIRIVPEKVNKEACFRFEIIGCDPDQGPDVSEPQSTPTLSATPQSTPVSAQQSTPMSQGTGLVGVDISGLGRSRRHGRTGKLFVP